MEKEFIDWATKEISGLVSVEKEATGDSNIVYKLQTPQGALFLKIGPGLEKERERLLWIADRQPVPHVQGFTQIGETSALLLSALEGKNLKDVCHELGPSAVIEILVEALHRFHSTKIKDCPFGSKGVGKVLVHGDACLPNFLVKDAQLSGYIDLEDTRIDTVDVDLAAAIWSLQYNFGPGHGIAFLARFGIQNPSEEMEEKLYLQYEKMQEEWGL